MVMRLMQCLPWSWSPDGHPLIPGLLWFHSLWLHRLDYWYLCLDVAAAVAVVLPRGFGLVLAVVLLGGAVG